MRSWRYVTSGAPTAVNRSLTDFAKCIPAEIFGGRTLDTNLERKAFRYRELAREVLDEALRVELEKLAGEYETAARAGAQRPWTLDPAA